MWPFKKRKTMMELWAERIKNVPEYVPEYSIGDVLCEDPFGIGMCYTIIDIKEGWYSMEYGYKRNDDVKCTQAQKTGEFERKGYSLLTKGDIKGKPIKGATGD